VRLLLEAYYEPQFSDRSHGFRPGRGCHTALSEVVDAWKETHWFVEGDISDCFGSLDHDLMIRTLAEKIHDGRFLRLIGHMLKAGYLEDWRWNATLSGCPQGGIASPVLSNIYLDRFDQYVEQRLLPEHNHGQRRRANPAYQTVEYALARARRHGDRAEAHRLILARRRLPSHDPNDPDYRRLRYVRYAADWLLGFAGAKHEAEQIKSKIATFLRDELKLELSQSKTLITHATSQAAHFLGYEIRAQHADTKITRHRRAVNGAIGLFVPQTVIRQRCALYTSNGKPAQRGVLLHDDDYTIVAKYAAEYAGLVQYYLLAQDVFRLGRLRWVMETSMLKTLAGKHRSTVTAMARKYKTRIETPAGPRTVFQVTVTRDRGKTTGRPLRRNPADQTAHSHPHRPAAGHGQHPAQRADPPAPRWTLRALPGHGEPGGPPCPQARRPHHARPAGETRLHAPHGHATTQDPGDLPPLPRRHPRRTGHHTHPTVTTGEPGAGKLARRVREEPDGKGPAPRAPRQRPTSL
jgi:Reverse transcriptase (RNA-dependent DNA polymerase)/Type II intron maturase